MKSWFLAFLLSLVLPGAGLWYLRRYRRGWINFSIVMIAAAVLIFRFPELYAAIRGPFEIGVQATSGAIALAQAQPAKGTYDQETWLGLNLRRCSTRSG